MSGPGAEATTDAVAISLAAWRWPLVLEDDDEGHQLIVCGREWCRMPVLDLSKVECARGFGIELGQLVALVVDHLQECRPAVNG